MIAHVVTSINEVPKGGVESGSALVRAEFCDFDEFVLAYRPEIEGGGIFLETPNLLPLKQKVKIEFSIAASQLKIIEGCGEVVQIISPAQDTAGGIMIRFLNLEDKSKKLLSKLSESYI